MTTRDGDLKDENYSWKKEFNEIKLKIFKRRKRRNSLAIDKTEVTNRRLSWVFLRSNCLGKMLTITVNAFFLQSLFLA